MKKIYSISYDFRNPDSGRSAPFFKLLQGLGPWCHFLKGTWLTVTDLTAKQLFAKLEHLIDDDLHLLITEVGPDFSGWLPKEAWEWLRDHQKETAESAILNGSLSG